MATIAVLAFQGAYGSHCLMLKKLGVATRLVTKRGQLRNCDALIIPGGESTTISRALDFIDMREEVILFARNKPVFGTCAGLIIMADKESASSLKLLGLMDIVVNRNGFGRQYDSFSANIYLSFTSKPFRGIFIRAPRIRYCGKNVEVLAVYKGEPVLVRQKNLLAASFHPELVEDSTIHTYFLSML